MNADRHLCLRSSEVHSVFVSPRSLRLRGSLWFRKRANPMWKKILLGLVVVVVVFVIVVALQPAHFTVSRSATMAAPPERVFAQVNDFKAWNAWSPWTKLDPNCKYIFGDVSAGQGATYAWEGNGDV